MARVVGRIDLERAIDVIASRRRRALILALEYVLTESRKLVPHQEGTLERSGRVVVEDDGSRGAVTYDTPYAVRQHEDLSLQHNAGREAKYLEKVLLLRSAVIAQIIAQELGRALQ